MKVKAIFFDVTDTLYTSEAMEAAYPQKLVELLAKARNIPQEDAEKLMKETAASLKGTVKHVTKVHTMAALGFSRAQVHEALSQVNPYEFLKPDPPLNDLMARLAKHYKLGVITNVKKAHLVDVLKALGLNPEFFPLLVTEDIVQEIKPHPEPFLKAISLSGFAADECLYVGDSPTKDMWPAKEVGMKTVLIGDSLAEEHAGFVNALIPNVKELEKVL